MATLDLSYPAILKLFGNYVAEGLTESQALLKWFLENFYRLDVIDVEDSICDQPGDKGIDGIYINELFQQINVFQTWLRCASTDKDLGDRDLKEFLGTLTQLQTADGVRKLSAATKSVNLRKLLERLEVDKKVGEGYGQRYLCNKSVGQSGCARFDGALAKFGCFRQGRIGSAIPTD